MYVHHSTLYVSCILYIMYIYIQLLPDDMYIILACFVPSVKPHLVYVYNASDKYIIIFNDISIYISNIHLPRFLLCLFLLSVTQQKYKGENRKEKLTSVLYINNIYIYIKLFHMKRVYMFLLLLCFLGGRPKNKAKQQKPYNLLRVLILESLRKIRCTICVTKVFILHSSILFHKNVKIE